MQGGHASQHRIDGSQGDQYVEFLHAAAFCLSAAAAAATLGLSKPLIFAGPAFAETPVEPTVGFYKYKVGDIEVTAIYDGIWRKPHDPTFIKNASVEDTKAALAKAGLTTDFMPIPLTVVVLKIGARLIMMDARLGRRPVADQRHHLPANMAAAGIDYKAIDTIMISHFHPDHVWGLMEKGTNAPVFPNAELIVNATEYNWWTDPGRLAKLPEGRKPAGKRIAENFPKWKNWKLVERRRRSRARHTMIAAPGHTPGHSVFLANSGNEQLMISADTMYVPALLAPHPEWQGATTKTGRRPSQRVKDHRPGHRRQHQDLRLAFPVPRRRHFVKDGNAYGFTPPPKPKLATPTKARKTMKHAILGILRCFRRAIVFRALCLHTGLCRGQHRGRGRVPT